MKKYQAICLFSGGLDSTTVAVMLANAKIPVLLVYIKQGCDAHDYHAKKVAESLSLPIKMISLEDMFGAAKRNNYIPGYKMFMSLAAISLADKYYARTIYNGEILAAFNQIDENKDPDITLFSKFLDGFADYEDHTLSKTRLVELYGRMYGKGENVEYQFSFIEPFWGFKKENIVHLAHQLKVPIQYTLSCRNPEINNLTRNPDGLYPHCGKSSCIACNQRRMGFELAELSDPVIYHYNEPIPKEYRKLATQASVFGRMGL